MKRITLIMILMTILLISCKKKEECGYCKKTYREDYQGSYTGYKLIIDTSYMVYLCGDEYKDYANWDITLPYENQGDRDTRHVKYTHIKCTK